MSVIKTKLQLSSDRSFFSVQKCDDSHRGSALGPGTTTGVSVSLPTVITVRNNLHFSPIFVQKQNQSCCLCGYVFVLRSAMSKGAGKYFGKHLDLQGL